MASSASSTVIEFVRPPVADGGGSRDAAEALRELAGNVTCFEAGQDIVRQEEPTSQCCVVLDGWACHSKILDDGRRQIGALHFRGAMPDLDSFATPALNHSITTLTKARVAFIPHAKLRALQERMPSLGLLLWQDALGKAAVLQEWAVNVGFRPAQERLAHLLCEVATRLERLHLATRFGHKVTFAWPLTQLDLADASGLSAVHVNRSLQALRAEGLIEMAQKWATILDLPQLAALAGFNPAYLRDIRTA